MNTAHTYLQTVYRLARYWRQKHGELLPLSDYVSEGNEALAWALDRWDASRAEFVSQEAYIVRIVSLRLQDLSRGRRRRNRPDDVLGHAPRVPLYGETDGSSEPWRDQSESFELATRLMADWRQQSAIFEQRYELYQLIDWLPAANRTLMLQLCQGYSQADLARKYQLTEGAISHRVKSTIKRLRTYYQHEGA